MRRVKLVKTSGGKVGGDYTNRAFNGVTPDYSSGGRLIRIVSAWHNIGFEP